MIIIFSLGELKMNDSYLKKLRTDSSSESESPSKKGGLIPNRIVVSDPAYQVPFRYGWKRELVSVLLDFQDPVGRFQSISL